MLAVKDPRTPEFITWRRLVAKHEAWEKYQENRQAYLSLGIKEPSPPFAVPWSEQDDIALSKAEEACPLLTIIDHGAAQGYLKFIAEITLPKEAEKHLHLHGNAADIPNMSEEDLRAHVARLAITIEKD